MPVLIKMSVPNFLTDTVFHMKGSQKVKAILVYLRSDIGSPEKCDGCAYEFSVLVLLKAIRSKKIADIYFTVLLKLLHSFPFLYDILAVYLHVQALTL